MKNKHLVLVFFSVLLLGLVLRRLPLRYRTLFESSLFRWEEKDVTRMKISALGRPDLLFERIDQGWGLEQEARTTVVPERVVSEMLDLLTEMQSFELIKTGRPDTLGLVPDKTLFVRLFQGKHTLETLEIGDEGKSPAGACTYIRLPEHGGVYRVPGHLRRYFARTLQDFRSKTIVSMQPDAVRRIELSWPGETPVVLERQDSLWSLVADMPARVSFDTMRAWLVLFDRLKNSPFADYFDESSEAETLFASITFEAEDTTETLRIFYLEPPEVPEEPADLRRKDRTILSAYVAHSSTNPHNYFALPDTSLARALGLRFLPYPGSRIKNR